MYAKYVDRRPVLVAGQHVNKATGSRGPAAATPGQRAQHEAHVVQPRSLRSAAWSGVVACRPREDWQRGRSHQGRDRDEHDEDPKRRAEDARLGLLPAVKSDMITWLTYT